MNERLIETAISRAGVVRVRNALNAMLWLCALCLLSSLIGLYFFRDDPELKYLLAGLLSLPVLATTVCYFWFMFREPNRLQSEEFVLRQQELSVERKSDTSLSVDQAADEDPLVIDAKRSNLPTGENS